MYCPYCQSSIVDDSVFCKQCGKRVNEVPEQPAPVDPFQQQAQQYQQQCDALRKNELSSLNHVLQHFAQKQRSYDLYHNVCANINRFARGASKALLVWGCIVFSIAATFILLLAPDMIDGYMYTEDIISALTIFGLLGFLPGILMIVGGILMKVNNHRKLSSFRDQYTALSHELYQHYLNYPASPVGPEYSDPRILIKIQDHIASGRANTISESLNHLVAASNQRAISQYMELTARNTAECNRQNNFGCILIPPHFFR